MARGLFNADGRLIGYQPGDVVTMVFGIDPAHGPDHSAVTVFEKHPDGSLRMVASEMRAELRPPAECAGKHGHHWIRTGCGATVAEWDADDQWWSLIREDQPVTASDMILVRGYHYLGPAEWRDPYVAANWESVVADKDATIAALTAENTQLRIENEALRVEKRHMLARMDEWRVGLPPRAHNFGVPVRVCNTAPADSDLNLPAKQAEYQHRFAGFMYGHWVEYMQTRDPLVVNLLKSVAGITPGFVALDYLEKELAAGLRAMTDDDPLSFSGIHAAHAAAIERQCARVGAMARQMADNQLKALSKAAEDPHPTNPTDEVHEAVERVIGHIADGKVTPVGRQALRGALDKAETPPTGRAASDAAIGRIARLA